MKKIKKVGENQLSIECSLNVFAMAQELLKDCAISIVIEKCSNENCNVKKKQ